MGYDNLVGFHKWQNSEQIAAHHHLIVFRRHQGEDLPIKTEAKYSIFEFPHLEISASEIRNRFKLEKGIQYMVPKKVAKFMDDNYIY